ncbi:C1 family peptidase [Methylobacterium sp. WL122]|nr:C1 family peptidase [Methylobacterium sp. WL122]
MISNRVKARSIAGYGFRRGLPSQRDHHFEPTAEMLASLPASVDLREHCPPVMDQGELGSCTAHGITGAIRFAMIKAGRSDTPLSRLQLYYDERVVEGTVLSDAGAEIRDGLDCAAKRGVAHESLWPYDIAKFKRKPGKAVYADALKFQVLERQVVQIDVAHLKAALASGFPVVVGFTVYQGFESDAAAKTGVVLMPGKKERPLGGHCVFAVGYGQTPGTFTLQNSWGADWGDKGCFTLPEAYLGSPTYASDFWAITKVE